MSVFLRMSAAGACAAALIAVTTFVGCGHGDSSDVPEPPEAPPRVLVEETVPIRMIFVAYKRAPDVPVRTKAEAIARANEVLAKLKTPNTSFETVAKEMSEDPVSAPDGGWYGFVADRPDNGDSPYFEAAHALKVGETSPSFGSQLGQQIIQRLSREEGKVLEAKYVAPIDSLVVPWHDVLVSLPITQTKDAAYEETAKVVVAIRAGEYPFGAAAGKLLGASPVSVPLRRVMRPAGLEKLSAAVFALKTDEITDPMDTPRGWVIAQRLPSVRCYARHIVITSETSPAWIKPNKRKPEAAQKLAQDALDRLRREPSAWDELCRKVSEEPYSKNIRGFVGDLSNAVAPDRRSKIPEFEEAVWKLKPGETSDLVDTRLGIHIFHRDD